MRALPLTSMLLALLFMAPMSAIGSAPDAGSGECLAPYQTMEDGPLSMSDLGFIENRGQWDDGPRFVASTGFGTIGASMSSLLLDVKGEPGGHSGAVLGIRFPGSSPRDPSGELELDTSINFMIGNAASAIGTRGYGHVVYEGLWPGIDLVVSLEDGCPKYEFVLDPGADPSEIVISLDGALAISESDGGMMIRLPGGGTVVDSAPNAYDVGSEGTVEVQYRIVDPLAYGFTVSGHDRTRTLVIDPLVYSTFVGGGGWDQGKSIATDEGGRAYICGHTDSMDLPATPGAYDEGYNGNIDGYVAGLSKDGSDLDWCTFFGGSSDDYCHEVALRGPEGIAICGHSYSEDLPVSGDAFDGIYSGMLDAYVAVLTRDGSSLSYCTYLGGLDDDYAYSMAVDHMGVMTVAGCTYSSDIPATEGAYQRASAGDADCLVCTFGADMGIGFITYVGGALEDRAYDVTVDTEGRAWIAGISYSSDYPVTEGAFDRTFNGGADVFLTRIDRDGGALAGSSFYGSTGSECANTIALSRSGYVAIAGRTTSSGLTMAGETYDPSFNGKADGFVAGFGPDAGTLSFSTFVGGTEVEDLTGIAFNGQGDIFLSGYSSSTDFPTTADALSTHPSGGFYDETMSVIDLDASALVYSTFIG